jgi:pantoate--beta-alanine ligase
VTAPSADAAAGTSTPPAPVVARTRAELRTARRALDRGDVAVVMTMGALHEGHGRLIRHARSRAGHVVVTIFLNPLQFGAGEDLSRYPRTVDSDLEICAREGVDLVFLPTPDVVYPEGDPGVRISAGALGDVLEGQARPGHFDGVLTVVGKMLHLTGADLAYYGQKDAQQLLLIRRMVQDLDFAVEVVSVPTVREPDGLAMSSRNAYLTAADRERARSLYRALTKAAELVAAGERQAETVQAAMQSVLAGATDRIDYAVLADAESLAPIEVIDRPVAALIAAFVGHTRLIDNHILTPPAA